MGWPVWTNTLVQQTQQCFQQLETNLSNYSQIEKDIQDKIHQINSNCEKLDILAFKVPVVLRQNAKMRCDQLKYDSRHLNAALSAWQQKRARRDAAVTEREQLLNRRFAPNPDITAINMDYAIQQQNAMTGAHQGVDEMLQTGTGTLESLRSQRATIKGAQRRIMDMANTLGLSNYTMKLIEKRALQDKYVLLGGMVVTIFVIVLVIVYFV